MQPSLGGPGDVTAERRGAHRGCAGDFVRRDRNPSRAGILVGRRRCGVFVTMVVLPLPRMGLAGPDIEAAQL